jgi:hypothetical protein
MQCLDQGRGGAEEGMAGHGTVSGVCISGEFGMPRRRHDLGKKPSDLYLAA